MRLGQHFMIDAKFLKRVVEAAGLRKSDEVLEVGAGEGALTRLLAERCSVISIERDKKLVARFKELHPDLPIIEGDALKVEWPEFDKCVSNLPYSISKRFLLKLLQQDFQLAVLVLQEEFAQKLVAEPGGKDYGVVSVCAQLCCDVELLDRVPRNAFKPQPKVDSRIVRLRRRQRLDRGFLRFVTKLFQSRNRRFKGKRVRDIPPGGFLTLYEGNNR